MMRLLTLLGCGEEHSLSNQINISNMVVIATEDKYRMGYRCRPRSLQQPLEGHQSLNMRLPFQHSTWIKLL